MLFLKINVFYIFLFCFISMTHAEYIEGIDTTDTDGYGLNSAFRIYNGSVSGQNIIIYHLNGYLNGYFDYSFNDIKIAPESIMCVKSSSRGDSCRFCAQYSSSQYPFTDYCFIIKKYNDSTYSKIQVLNSLTNKRYVFKYGTNTSPNNRMLEKESYDRSIRYKPNNFGNIHSYYGCDQDFPGFGCCFWQPPLPNDNHLIGYMFYKPKSGVKIDTTQPINLSQWDSTGFTTSISSGWSSEYLGLVAVYEEGKSDFLKNWWKPKLTEFPVGCKPRQSSNEKIISNLEIKKISNGFCISFQTFQATSGSASISIYNVTGMKVAKFSDIKTNKIYWKTTNPNIAEGMYIAKAQLSDKSEITKPFIIPR